MKRLTCGGEGALRRTLLGGKMLSFKQFALASLIVIGSGLGSGLTVAADEGSNHARENSTLFAMGQNGAVLLAIDVENRTTTVIGPTGSPPPLPSLALAITPDGTAAYTIAKANSPDLAQLAKIDLATGAATLVGQPLNNSVHYPANGLFVMGMTFSPDGVLYAAGDSTSPSPTFNSLYTIDLASGLASRVGSFGVGTSFSEFIMSFSFDPEGDMYGASMMSLYKIERTTGAATKVVDFKGASLVMGIAFDKQGRLYASDYIDLTPTLPGSTIYRVDLETGFFTPLFKTGIAFVHNIEFKPEPGCRNGNRNDNSDGNVQCNS